jgi:hypothetical protein
MKKVKNVIIDFKYLFIFLKQNNTNIDKLDFQIIDRKNDFEIINFLKNIEPEIFFNNHSNIKNIKQIYTIICDFFYSEFFKSDIKEKNNFPQEIIEKIKHYTTHYSKEQIENSFDQKDINVNKLKHYFDILNLNEKNFNIVITNMILKHIKKDGDFINFDSKYDDIGLLKRIIEPNVFFDFYKIFNGYSSNELIKEKKEKNILLLNIIDKVFKNINEDIKNKKIDITNSELGSFTSTYFMKMRQDFYNSSDSLPRKQINFDDIKKLMKTHPNLYYYYIQNDPSFHISKFINTKNEDFENKMIKNNKKDSIIIYLSNIFNELKKQNNSEEKIYEIIKKDFKKIFDFIIGSNYFVQYLMLYKPNLKFTSEINTKNIPSNSTEHFSGEFFTTATKASLLEKYFNEMKDENIKLKDIIIKYPNLLEVLNDLNHTYSKGLLEKYFKEVDENIDDIKKYSNIYYNYFIYNYNNLNVKDHFNLIKKNKKVFDEFKNNDEDIIYFLENYEKEIPFSLDELEEIIKTPFLLLVYFYFKRKRLSEKSERIINFERKSIKLYNDFLNNKKLSHFTSFRSFIDFLRNSMFNFDEFDDFDEFNEIDEN